MILMNSFAFELVMLCWFYSPPEEEPAVDAFVTINIVRSSYLLLFLNTLHSSYLGVGSLSMARLNVPCRRWAS